MAITESDRKDILRLLADGKITASEAAELLSSSRTVSTGEPDTEDLKRVEDEVFPEIASGKQDVRQASWFRIRVNDMKTGKRKVTVNIPLGLVRYGMSVGKRFAPELDGLDWNELELMLNENQGLLIDVEDEEDGEQVQVFVD